MRFYAAPFQLKFYAILLSPRLIVYVHEQVSKQITADSH